MNWKEQLEIHKRGARCENHDQDGTLLLAGRCPNCLKVLEALNWSEQFIETEIIEKLIEEIPDGLNELMGKGWNLHEFKNQLRAKWLK